MAVLSLAQAGQSYGLMETRMGDGTLNGVVVQSFQRSMGASDGSPSTRKLALICEARVLAGSGRRTPHRLFGARWRGDLLERRQAGLPASEGYEARNACPGLSHCPNRTSEMQREVHFVIAEVHFSRAELDFPIAEVDFRWREMHFPAQPAPGG